MIYKDFCKDDVQIDMAIPKTIKSVLNKATTEIEVSGNIWKNLLENKFFNLTFHVICDFETTTV